MKVRPFPQSGFNQLTEWFIDQTWDQAYNAQSAHEKAEIFQKLFIEQLNEVFPEKLRKISDDDAPWITFKLKKLDRQRKKIYHKERKSEKWRKLDKLFKQESKQAKAQFYKHSVEELKTKKPGQWYTCLKKITSQNQKKDEQPTVEELRHLSDQDQAEQIAAQFAAIQNEYDKLKKDDVSVPHFQRRFGLH